MEQTLPKSQPVKSKPAAAKGRDDRLKAALKANMARRKAQAKARAGDAAGTGPDGAETEQQQGE